MRPTRALTVLMPLLGGCAEWPRFANLPPADAAGLSPPAELELAVPPLVEPAEPGWPDLPEQLPELTQAVLGALWSVTRLEGVLSPAGENGEEKLPFACSPDASTVAYSSSSDIDWLHLQSDGGPLCLLLETEAPAESQWDVVIHAYDVDDACVEGSFLNPPAANGPQIVAPGVGSFVEDVPLGPLAVYVAGVSGLPVGTDVPYTVHVIPATVTESCAELELGDVRDLVWVP